MRKSCVALLLLAVCLAAAEKPLLVQRPTLSKTQIVFSYAGDLWAVDRTGGDARRLTNHPGDENNPVFSPDGSQIAFTGEYDGNIDVFVMPAAGGVPKRLTWHPGGDQVCGWSPDGRSILFRSGRLSATFSGRLFTVPPEGGNPTEIPLHQAECGSYSPDGKRLAYLPLAPAFSTWKWYRGGRTTKIWLADLADSKVTEIPRENSNDFNPLWVGNKVYFLSDRQGPVSLYAYDIATKKVSLALKNNGYFDFKAASAGPGAIVYEQLGGIHVFDLASGKSTQVPLRIEGDFPDLRSRYEKVNTQINAARISPTGVRAVFGAHGEILTVPAEKGDVRNLTNTPAVHERFPAWSPDGRWIAYFSDESGEYALHLRDQRGVGDVKKITLPPAFYYQPVWSPDSKKVAFTDQILNRWYVDIEKGTPVKVDTELYLDGRGLGVAWSPDSRWIVYPRALENHFRAIFVYSIEDGKATQITDGMGDARVAQFDKGGKYIYFTASTDVGPTLGDGLATFQRPSTRNVYLVTLRKDVPSPLSAESDEEKIAAEPAKPDPSKPDAPKPDAPKPEGAKPVAGAKPKVEPVRIDFDGITQRVVTIPVPARNYTNLLAGKENVLYLVEPPAPAAVPGPPPGQTVSKYDLKARKLDRIVDGVNFFDLSENGEKMLYARGFGPAAAWFIAGAAAPPPPTTTPLKLDQMEVRVEPQAEWKHMFREVWRNERDFFYDAGHHGLNLEETARQYEPFVEHIVSRNDLNYLFREMLGEINASHVGVGGGSQSQEVKRVGGGLLGADYKVENGRYRIAKIYSGENWNPQARAPLTEPGVDVKSGDYLIAVNGREVRGGDEVYQFFEATAGKQTTIKVSADATGANAREYTVVPVPNEQQLRYLDWIEGNRRKVELATAGQVGYIHLPDTANGGYTSFNRYLFAQSGKPAMIVDERFNGGGALADYVIEHLKRPLMNYITFRAGKDVTLPYGVVPGPKVMLINENAGSGGDAMPYYFKKAGVGPLIGKRTWGGLIRGDGAPQLLDGGFHSAPGAGIWAPNGEWVGENVGIGPDIEVDQDPAAVRAGRDPQLEKAIEYCMDQLKKNPPEKHKKPAYSRYKRGVKLPPTPTTGGGQ